MGNSNPTTGHNPLYLVTFEDPANKPKIRVFGCTKPERNPGFVEFQGYELTNIINHNTVESLKDIKTYDEMIKKCQDNQISEQSLVIPWQRVIHIQNISFAVKRSNINQQ